MFIDRNGKPAPHSGQPVHTIKTIHAVFSYREELLLIAPKNSKGVLECIGGEIRPPLYRAQNHFSAHQEALINLGLYALAALDEPLPAPLAEPLSRFSQTVGYYDDDLREHQLVSMEFWLLDCSWPRRDVRRLTRAGNRMHWHAFEEVGQLKIHALHRPALEHFVLEQQGYCDRSELITQSRLLPELRQAL